MSRSTDSGKQHPDTLPHRPRTRVEPRAGDGGRIFIPKHKRPIGDLIQTPRESESNCLHLRQTIIRFGEERGMDVAEMMFTLAVMVGDAMAMTDRLAATSTREDQIAEFVDQVRKQYNSRR